MASPTYVATTNMVRGVDSAEAAINVESTDQEWPNPKDYALDRFGGRTGFATDYDAASTISLSGEINTASVTGAFAASYGAALTIANAESGYGVTTGDWLLDNIRLSKNRGAWQSASMDATQIPALTVA